MRSRSKPKIYFYCCPEPDNLQHDIICLGEGLKDLSIEFYSNTNYWLNSTNPNDFLFKATPDVVPDDCDIVIIPFTWYNWVRLRQPTIRRATPNGLFKSSRKYITVYTDMSDGYKTVSWEDEFRQFDFIFRSHYNQRCDYYSNIFPWQLGLSNRIINYTKHGLPYQSRDNSILWNFGASHPYPHGLREMAAKKFKPRINSVLAVDSTIDNLAIPPINAFDYLMWQQTAGRHSPLYYSRLKSAKACAAFCGVLVPPVPHNPSRILVGGNKAKIRYMLYELSSKFDRRYPRNIQWDSWRFWESLAAGCVPFHIELEKYGIALPVMPENWEHYIGVDFNNIDLVVDRLSDEPNILEKISKQGQKWALDYYSPKAVARRFLKTIGYETNVD